MSSPGIENSRLITNNFHGRKNQSTNEECGSPSFFDRKMRWKTTIRDLMCRNFNRLQYKRGEITTQMGFFFFNTSSVTKKILPPRFAFFVPPTPPRFASKTMLVAPKTDDVKKKISQFMSETRIRREKSTVLESLLVLPPTFAGDFLSAESSARVSSFVLSRPHPTTPQLVARFVTIIIAFTPSVHPRSCLLNAKDDVVLRELRLMHTAHI